MREQSLISDAKTESLEEGRTERESEIAHNLLSLGVSIENIAKSTGLTVEQISKYR
ncbi:MAG: hypothetical protein LBG77_05630 [Dysgonamonadaceae bacterium]|jgi:predicted transposase/invertase (TIGR01784 family)|nr:hypothetical protein [Dysgonamonadaceae bacterium]